MAEVRELKETLKLNALGNLLGHADSLALVKIDMGSPVLDSPNVHMDIEADGGGDIPFYIDGEVLTLDCTTGDGVGGKARITLSLGSLEEPAWQVIYASYSEQATKVTLKTSAQIPSGEGFLSVAYAMMPDYASVVSWGSIVWHRTTDMASWGGRSATSYSREKLRLALQNNRITSCECVLDITPNVGSRDTINVISSPGSLYQIHLHDWNGYTAFTDGIRVVGQEVGQCTILNNQVINDLGEISETSQGETIPDGHTILMDLLAVINSAGEEYLAVMVGKDTYLDAVEAVHNAKLAPNKRYPKDIDQVCATIGRVALTYSTANNGTWTNALSASTSTWQWDTEIVNEETPGYPGYENNVHQYFGTTHNFSGATKIRIHFRDFETEANYDFVRLRNAAEDTVQEYHGSLGAFVSADIPGNTVRFWFDSDGSVKRNGAYIDYLEYYHEVTTGGVSGEVLDRR